MSNNEMNKKENFKSIFDIVEIFDMSYHMGKVLENAFRLELATSRDEAEELARMAKSCIDRYVAFQWKGCK